MIDNFYVLQPYELGKEEKSKLLTKELLELTGFHKDRCKNYANFLNAVGFKPDKVTSPEDIPFFPVRAFKDVDLLSVPQEEIFKTMTSSGTTGQRVSKIFVDKDTAMIQQKVMVKILGDYWGKKRLPILVIDSKATVRNRESFSARGAAIIGLQVVAREMVYALNDDMTLNAEVVKDFLEKYSGQRFIIFGFTFIVWQSLYLNSDALDFSRYDLSDAFLMTGGGWKKLISESVSQDTFKQKMTEAFGIKHYLDGIRSGVVLVLIAHPLLFDADLV